MKLLLGDAPRDEGNEDSEVITLQDRNVGVSKFIIVAKGELKNWKYEEAQH